MDLCLDSLATRHVDLTYKNTSMQEDLLQLPLIPTLIHLENIRTNEKGNKDWNTRNGNRHGKNKSIYKKIRWLWYTRNEALFRLPLRHWHVYNAGRERAVLFCKGVRRNGSSEVWSSKHFSAVKNMRLSFLYLGILRTDIILLRGQPMTATMLLRCYQLKL